MPRRPCADCWAERRLTLVEPPATRCDEHQAKAAAARRARGREYEKTRNRGSATARGYGAAWQRLTRQLIAAATGCAYCPEPFTPGDPPTVDHIIPVARGGTHDRSNLLVCHRSCNSRRGGQMNRRR